MKKPTFVIVGAGKVGTALAHALTGAGYPLIGISSRSLKSAENLAKIFSVDYADRAADLAAKADMVFITTPDRAIGEVVKELAASDGFQEQQVVFHVSGAAGASILAPAKQFGAAIGAMHPLKAFAGKEKTDFTGVYFAIDGDTRAREMAEQLIAGLAGISFYVAEQYRPMYHAAACAASNYLVALMHWTIQLCRNFGLSEAEVLRAFFPLVHGTLENIQNLGTVQALSGPISRGDCRTVAAHLAVVDKQQEQELYRVLGVYTLNIARQKGLNDRKAQQMENLLIIKGGAES
ncbi:Rossmann-like and DUF2520 domain-containing protein [Acetonema longum]|uniref:NADP oxidoreductase coenzyme F420-dependent n=1 Tax=Acetonema longum DSM 6540 TaxID=1009370 RepID=F7NFU3_9FIRM|nr:DUF2520 domain-containing protein [Acetonema longum]EGO65089.1 NADP oxidoreductase coenzyme F420-dependent [Acetonema longum DSM 6540]